MRAAVFAVYAISAALCSLTTGCSAFILTMSYHQAATDRSTFTPIRASTVDEAYLDPDGVLTLAFSGWNHSRNMEPGTERSYMVRIPTMPSHGSSDVSQAPHSGDMSEVLRVLTFDEADVEPLTSTPPDAIPIPLHVASMDEIRQTRWDGFASRQVGPGVWVRTDRLQFLYVPSPEHLETTPRILAQSHGEYVRTYPVLIYAYPIAVPVLLVVDVVTLPIKAVGVLWFFVTWDGSMF